MKQLKRMLAAFMSIALIGCFLSSDLSCGVLQPVTVQAAKKSSNSTVKLNKTKITLKPDETFKLKISGKYKTVSWRSSNTAVAIIKGNGKIITNSSVGTSTITASVNIGTKHKIKKLKCKVTVEDYSEEYVLAREAIKEAAFDAGVGSTQFNYENQVLHISKIIYQNNMLNEKNHTVSCLMMRYYVPSAEYSGNRYLQIIKTTNPDDYNYKVEDFGDYYIHIQTFLNRNWDTAGNVTSGENEDALKLFNEISENGSVIDNKKALEIFRATPQFFNITSQKTWWVKSEIYSNKNIVCD